MKYELIILKLKYYRDWYNTMTGDERTDYIGMWVYNRATIFHSLLADFEKDTRQTSIGDYKVLGISKEELN
jgi:hypothetical protein